MGVLYFLLPLTNDIDGMYQWLNEQGVIHKNEIGRYPTPREIKLIADSLPGFVVEYRPAIDDFTEVDITSINLEGQWTQIIITKPGGLDVAAELYFAKGWPEVIVKFVHLLSYHTGPQVLIINNGETPFVISSDSNIDEILKEMEKY